MRLGQRHDEHAVFWGHLDWLPRLEANSVDLIYLDPPFNSQASYNLLYKSPESSIPHAQYQAFENSWTWDDPASFAFHQVMTSGSPAAAILSAIKNYRADIGEDGGGSPLIFDPSPALTAIDGLLFLYGPTGRYLVDDDGNAVCAWPGAHRALQSLRFCQIRRTGLPQLERAGTVSDLNIAADAGLLETVDVTLFPDNIVGADFNFYRSQLSRLGYYLQLKSGNRSLWRYLIRCLRI